MFDWKIKLIIGLSIISLIGLFFTWKYLTIPISNPIIQEKIVYQDKIVYKDKIVEIEKPVAVIKDRVITKTITEKGTCEEKIIETYIPEVQKEKINSASQSESKVIIEEKKIEMTSSTNRFGLGLDLSYNLINKNFYPSIELDYKLTQNLEVYGRLKTTMKVDSIQEIGLGLKINF